MNMAATAIRWGTRAYLYAVYQYEKLTRSGGFGRDGGVYIRDPLPLSGNRIKDFLYKFHVKQFHESSCSVASVASVINAISAFREGCPPGPPVTQQELLETVRAAHWKERMSENGYNGRRGLPLETLGQVVKASLEVYGLSHRSVEVVSAVAPPGGIRLFKETLRKRLSRFEKKGDCLLIAHFNQGRFLPDLHIPHISPVGGFDPGSNRVTMLDVDPLQKYPYQISFDTFYKGISCNYHHVFKPFGYDGGGYIRICL